MTSELTTTPDRDILGFLQARAKDVIFERGDDIPLATGIRLEAEINHEVLRQSVELRAMLRSFQGELVAQIVRERLWVYYPHENFTDDYDGLRAFLQSAGLGASSVSELASLYYIVQSADAWKIPITHYLENGNWTRTRETVTMLKQSARDDDKDTFKEILSDIDKTSGADTTTARAALRTKWRKRRGSRAGQATTTRLPDGRWALVAAFDDEGELQKAIARIGGMVRWELRDVTIEV